MKAKQIILTFLTLFTSITASAYDACIDGIYYNFSGTTASVTYKTESDKGYSGSVVIPFSVTYNETTYNVIEIEAGAFPTCDDLTSITIPNSVTLITGGAFCYCHGLTSIVVENGNPKYDSRNGCNAIIETETNTLITGCNGSVIPDNVTKIGNSAFFGIRNLIVTIPNSVTEIDNFAFYQCSGLTSVTIPENVTKIGAEAFASCECLTSITIPNSVTSIGGEAFWDCPLTSITIPSSVTSIGMSPFHGCSSLTSIVVEDGNTRYDSRNGCNAIIPNRSLGPECVLHLKLPRRFPESEESLSLFPVPDKS